MNYGTCKTPTQECTCAPESIESLTEIMKTTRLIGTDVLMMVRRINIHMFGKGNSCCEKEADPTCFRDELTATRCELLATLEELQTICSMLGM